MFLKKKSLRLKDVIETEMCEIHFDDEDKIRLQTKHVFVKRFF